MSFFHFLKFVMNFSKGVVSICHSFRSTGQLGRINGFDRDTFKLSIDCTAQRGEDFPRKVIRLVYSVPLTRSAALRSNIFNPEIHGVDL